MSGTHSDISDTAQRDQPPPPAPRNVSPRASRRAWNEPRVYFWWLIGILLLTAAAYLGVEQGLQWASDTSLLRSGKRVDALIWWREGARVKNRPIEYGQTITVVFPWDSREIAAHGRFALRGAQIVTGQTIPIYVDPKNPQHWTAHTKAPSLARQMIGAALLMSVAVVVFIISFALRRRVLITWRDGEAWLAAVIQTQQTALAPRSQVVRCALLESSDRRAITVYVPRAAASLERGDKLWLIMPPGRPDKSIAGMLYV